MRRRSLLALALSAGSGVAVSLAGGHGKATSRSRQPRPVPPLRRGSRLRAINPGTWMDPETDFTPLLQRCAAQGWHLEIPESVRGQWQWFSATDDQRRASIEVAPFGLWVSLTAVLFYSPSGRPVCWEPFMALPGESRSSGNARLTC